MKIKYYLRGLGVGIIITTLILLVVFNTTGKNISDEEIIERAKNLGMVMQETDESTSSGKLLDSFGNKNNESSLSATSDSAVTKDDDSQSDDTTTNSAIDSSDKDKTSASQDISNTSGSAVNVTDDNKDDKTDEKTSATANNSERDDEPDEKEGFKDIVPKTPPIGTRVTITINSGDVSRNVCEKLYAEGVIKNAAEFNDYLQDTNYDNFLHGGDHVIVVGDDFETIAKKLMGRIEE